MLDLEGDYQKEVAARHGKFFSKKESAVAARYAEARFAWVAALNDAAASADPRTQAEARLIAFRDTTLREEELCQKGKEEGLSERGKTALGAAARWGAISGKTVLKGYGYVTNKSGEGIAALHRGISSKEFTVAQKQELAQKYARAARILAGAGIGTVAMGGFGGLGLGLSFVVRAARGTLGIAAGGALGSIAGSLYKKNISEKARLDLRSKRRGVIGSVQDLLTLDSAQKRGNREARAKTQRTVEFVAAMIGGGVTSLGSGAAIEAFSGTEAVQKAVDHVQEAAPALNSHTALTQTPESVEHVTQAASASVAEGNMAEAVIGKGEGFNQLFVDLREAGLEGDSVVVKHLLNPNLTASELSSEVTAIDGLKNAVTQVGDKLFVDKDGSLWFERDGQQQLLMESRNGELLIHELKGLEMRVPVGASSDVPSPSFVADSVPAVEGTSIPEDTARPYEIPAESVGPVIDESSEQPEPAPRTIGTPLENFRRDVSPVESSQGIDTVRTPGTIGRSLEEFQSTYGNHDAVIEQGAPGFLNPHGVEITPSVPGTYEWRMPNTNVSYAIAYGGSPDVTLAWVHEELRLNPEAKILVVTDTIDPATGAPAERVDAWKIGQDGQAIREEGIIDPATNRSVPSPDPRDFTRKIR